MESTSKPPSLSLDCGCNQSGDSLNYDRENLESELFPRWQKIVNLLSRTIHSPIVAITRHHPPNLKVLCTNTGTENFLSPGMVVPLEGLLCERVLSDRKPYSVSLPVRETKLPQVFHEKWDWVSYYGIPVNRPDGELLGTLCAFSPQKDNFSNQAKDLIGEFRDVLEDHLNLLHDKIILSQNFTSLQSTQSELDKSNRQLSAILRAQTCFFEEDQAKDIFRELLKEIMGLIQSEYGFISSVSNRETPFNHEIKAQIDHTHPEDHKSIPDPIHDFQLNLDKPGSVMYQMADRREPVINNSLHQNNPCGSQLPGNPNINSFISLPLFYGDRFVGVLTLGSSIERYSLALADQLKPFLGICGQIIWLTQRKKENSETEERLRFTQFAIDNASDSAFWIEANSARIVYVNKKACKSLGFSREELLNKTVHDIDPLFPREKWEAHREELQKVSSKVFESIHEKKDGTRFPVEVSVHFTRFSNTCYFIAFVRNITFRKKAEKALAQHTSYLETAVQDRNREMNRALIESRRHRDHLDSVLNSMREGVIVSDRKGLVILANPPAEKYFQNEHSQIYGQSLKSLFPDVKIIKNLMANIEVPGDMGSDFDWQGENPEGSFILRCRIAQVRNDHDQITGLVLTLDDITLEREIDNMKTEFLTTAAHEFRTPLTSIQGFAELLSTCGLSDMERTIKFSRRINQEAEHLSYLVNDLLDISKIESGESFVICLDKCPIQDLIEEELAAFREISVHHCFSVHFLDHRRVWQMDREKMKQVLNNILGNAVKYSPQGGRIEIVIDRTPDGNNRISINDEGIGISEKDLPLLFNRFFRGSHKDHKSYGTGLGLSIVKHIIDSHGGSIKVNSRVGEGTNVSITLPHNSSETMDDFIEHNPIQEN